MKEIPVTELLDGDVILLPVASGSDTAQVVDLPVVDGNYVFLTLDQGGRAFLTTFAPGDVALLVSRWDDLND